MRDPGLRSPGSQGRTHGAASYPPPRPPPGAVLPHAAGAAAIRWAVGNTDGARPVMGRPGRLVAGYAPCGTGLSAAFLA